MNFCRYRKNSVYKHLEYRQKYSAERRIFNSLLGVSGYPDETLSLVFDILLSLKLQLLTWNENNVKWPLKSLAPC